MFIYWTFTSSFAWNEQLLECRVLIQWNVRTTVAQFFLFFFCKIQRTPTPHFQHEDWLTFGPPPCIFSARMVATRTTTSGCKPEARHLMLKNFSMPISAPNPASVTERQIWSVHSMVNRSLRSFWREEKATEECLFGRNIGSRVQCEGLCRGAGLLNSFQAKQIVYLEWRPSRDKVSCCCVWDFLRHQHLLLRPNLDKVNQHSACRCVRHCNQSF